MESFFTRRSNIALFILLFLTLVIAFTFVLVKQRQEIRRGAVGATTLELQPNSPEVNQGDEFTLDVVVNTGANQILSADLTLIYDSQILEGVSFTKGTFLPNEVVAGIIGNGAAVIKLDTPTTSPKTGTGILATLRFRALNPTTATTVAFNSFMVTAVNETGNVVTSTTPAVVEVIRTVIPDTEVSLVPSLTTVNIGQDVEISVNVNSRTNQISTADLTINYNSSVFDGISFEKGTFFSGTLGTSSIQNGVAEITVVTSTAIGPVQGTGLLAKLTLRGKANGTSNITIDPVTRILGVGSSENMLEDKNNTSVIVGTGQNPSPSPTPTPSPSPTPTPSATATPAPSPTPTATPTPSPDDDAAPQPTPSPTSSTAGCFREDPDTPEDLTAAADTTPGKIRLTWDRVSNVTHYGIVYGLSSGNYDYGAWNVGNTTSILVSGLVQGRTYYFAVFANNGCAASGFSGEASAKAGVFIGGGTRATPRPSPLPTTSAFVRATPEPEFIPLDPDEDPIAFLQARTSYVEASPEIPEIPEVSVPPEPVDLGKSPWTSPVVGAILIVIAILIGIYFIKTRT